jgi:CubicO group peptidase (beta-lactamase class C family)
MMNTANPNDLGFSPERLIRINDFMKRYVEEGKVAGFVTLVSRHGKIAFFDKYGYQNITRQTPIALDTIFRIYSMTKPIASVALMMLFERGLVRLEDPVSKFIPQFKNTKVYEKDWNLVDQVRPMTVKNLLTHTAGLSYGGSAQTNHPVDSLYDLAGLQDPGINLEEMVRRIAGLPLLYQPGTRWYYSVATDVVGRLVEVIAGMSLAEFLDEKIFKPLGMVDSGFSVPTEKTSRLATLYGKSKDSILKEMDETIGRRYDKVSLYSGGGGLVSTALDYFRFAQMVLNNGELDGVRLLGPQTVKYMTTNHLPPSLIPLTMGEAYPGLGFGLGFSVVLDVALNGQMGSPGEHGWGGWASTNFWIDPLQQLIAILMVQYIPSGTYPLANDLHTAVYQALIG